MVSIFLFPIYQIDTLTQDDVEKRALAKKSALFMNDTINLNFGRDTEDWLQDHFYQRATIVHLYNTINTWLEYKVSGKITNNKAFVGKDDWIFYKAEGSIANFQNAKLFSQDELIATEHAIKKRKEWLEQHGIAYYVFIPPDKNRVYPEYYPDGIFKVNDKGRAEQLHDFLKEKGDVKILYPYQELLAHKNEGLLYWKTDTHWNNYGGFIGYTALMNVITQDFPTITPLTQDDFILKQEPHVGGDLLSMLYPTQDATVKERYSKVLYPTLYSKREYDFKYLDTNDISRVRTLSPRKYKVIVFRDSFTDGFLPYLSQVFGDVEYIASHNMNAYEDYIIERKPDIVIFEMLERFIGTLEKNILPKE